MTAVMAGARGLVKVISLGILAVHLLLTALYVLPPNPIKVPVSGLLDMTIGWYARQNWSLFAPNPVSQNQQLLAKCLEYDGVKDELKAEAERRETAGWADMSSPFWTSFQNNRFSAYGRLVRPQTNSIRAYLSGGSALASFADSCNRKNDQEACEIYQKGLAETRKSTETILQKIGSVFCREYAPEAAISYVALRVRVSSTVPWSERHNPAFVKDSTDLSLGVFPIDRQVALSGVIRAETGR